MTGSSASEKALERSRSGFGYKIHALTDALGLPIRFTLTGRQVVDSSQAISLLEGISTLPLLADKGYHANKLLAWGRRVRFER